MVQPTSQPNSQSEGRQKKRATKPKENRQTDRQKATRPIKRRGQPVPNYTPHQGSLWIEGHRDTLPNNNWVAADRSGLVAQNTTIDGLLEEVKAEGKKLSDVAIAFITDDSA